MTTMNNYYSIKEICTKNTHQNDDERKRKNIRQCIIVTTLITVPILILYMALTFRIIYFTI